MDIRSTWQFDKWINSIRDSGTRLRIDIRLRRIKNGNFGDHKSVGGGVYELRCGFGGGVRIYYGIVSGTAVLLLAGGNKSTQSTDIKIAKTLLRNYKEEGDENKSL